MDSRKRMCTRSVSQSFEGKNNSDIDFCDSSGEWPENLALDKLKVEIIETDPEGGDKIVCKTCEICEGAFATATSLRRHVRVMHETVRSFKCHFCEEAFTSKQALKQHMGIHKDVDPLKCQLCGERMPNLDEYIAHKNKHIELKQSGNCEYCGNKTFYFGLKEHIEKKHQPRSCDICSLVFYDDKSMENHKKSHQEEPLKEDFICNICNKQFEFPLPEGAHKAPRGELQEV
ncbi:hypothetical protein NQ318_002119 [Aromia moschata]|uniref:C2H2-type domain-containing protein n=1 Tax=Aromia moschata TaxID=1265417 RepID=A0AAV8Y0I6_9CUCU|nr:hypothetical protein NQ318_002119 [Aromia moschata]